LHGKGWFALATDVGSDAVAGERSVMNTDERLPADGEGVWF